MKIVILDEGVISCDGLICDPIGLWQINQNCGSCPFIRLAERFCDVWCQDLIVPKF
jgi:hypothetical protein